MGQYTGSSQAEHLGCTGGKIKYNSSWNGNCSKKPHSMHAVTNVVFIKKHQETWKKNTYTVKNIIELN